MYDLSRKKDNGPLQGYAQKSRREPTVPHFRSNAVLWQKYRPSFRPLRFPSTMNLSPAAGRRKKTASIDHV